jgi:hypothetical protein
MNIVLRQMTYPNCIKYESIVQVVLGLEHHHMSSNSLLRGLVDKIHSAGRVS